MIRDVSHEATVWALFAATSGVSAAYILAPPLRSPWLAVATLAGLAAILAWDVGAPGGRR